MSEPTRDEIYSAAEKAIGVFLSELGQSFSTGRYVLMVEAINGDGLREIWMAAHKDQTAWDSLGLLQYGIQVEQRDLIEERY